MKNLNDVIGRIKKQFEGIHVEIEKHDVIGGEYEVSCYGLPENLFDAVSTFIFDLNDELYPDYEIELIPILYTKEETREHFPAIADQLLMESISRAMPAPRFLPAHNTELPTNPCVCHPTNLQNPVYAMVKPFKTWPNSTEKTAVDETYAQAA